MRNHGGRRNNPNNQRRNSMLDSTPTTIREAFEELELSKGQIKEGLRQISHKQEPSRTERYTTQNEFGVKINYYEDPPAVQIIPRIKSGQLHQLMIKESDGDINFNIAPFRHLPQITDYNTQPSSKCSTLYETSWLNERGRQDLKNLIEAARENSHSIDDCFRTTVYID